MWNTQCDRSVFFPCILSPSLFLPLQTRKWGKENDDRQWVKQRNRSAVFQNAISPSFRLLFRRNKRWQERQAKRPWEFPSSAPFFSLFLYFVFPVFSLFFVFYCPSQFVQFRVYCSFTIFYSLAFFTVFYCSFAVFFVFLCFFFLFSPLFSCNFVYFCVFLHIFVYFCVFLLICFLYWVGCPLWNKQETETKKKRFVYEGESKRGRWRERRKKEENGETTKGGRTRKNRRKGRKECLSCLVLRVLATFRVRGRQKNRRHRRQAGGLTW